MTRIAVLGPGGVGGFLAAALARAGQEVVVIARSETAAELAGRGIQVKSVRLGDFAARPFTATALRDPADVLIVATKATAREEALERIQAPVELVVPMLNGLDHLAVLRERFGADRVPAAAIRIESDRPETGVIVQTSPFLRVDLASDNPALRPRLERFASVLESAGIPAEVVQSEAQAMWSKLVRLNALALTTSASGRSIGYIRTDPEWRAALIGCIEEATAVANADGADIDPADRVGELDAAHGGLGSSMQRDIAAGRPPELDAIAGAVLRAGARHGIRTPTIERLVAEVAERAGVPVPAAS
jgi:2-dehydropantoate 2-reductase